MNAQKSNEKNTQKLGRVRKNEGQSNPPVGTTLYNGKQFFNAISRFDNGNDDSIILLKITASAESNEISTLNNIDTEFANC